MPIRQRVLAAVVVAVLCLGFNIAYLLTGMSRYNDLEFPFCAAQQLLRRADPYSGACTIASGGRVFPSNPLTAVVVALPLAWMGMAGSLVLWSIMAGALVYGLLRDGEWWRLLALASAPFVTALDTLQWSPLLLAVALMPGLLPLALVKPHIGAPIILLGLSWRRAAACAALLGLTLLIDPTWPLRWLSQTATYDGYIPAAALPLSLLLLGGLWRWRDRRAQYLLLMAAVPQRGLYDLLVLWWLADTPRRMLALTALSWAAYAAAWAGLPLPHAAVALIYLPLLAMLLAEGRRARGAEGGRP